MREKLVLFPVLTKEVEAGEARSPAQQPAGRQRSRLVLGCLNSEWCTPLPPMAPCCECIAHCDFSLFTGFWFFALNVV